MQKINIIYNVSDRRKKLFRSAMSILVLSIVSYVSVLLAIVVTAIDYKHIASEKTYIAKSTVGIERRYAEKVNSIEEKQIYALGYEKVDASFVVRKDSDANFSLLYGQ